MSAITIERAALLPALAQVAAVVPGRATIPILSNLLLEWADDSLRLTGTDLDVMLTAQADAQVPGAGAITLPADLLLAAVKRGEDGGQVELTLPATGDRVGVAVGRARYRLASLPAVDFPAPRAMTAGVAFQIGGKALARAIGVTQHAISTEETRYYLNGIHVHPHEDKLRFVATDGHRLALHAIALPAGAAALPPIIVPRGAMRPIGNLCDAAGEGTLDVACDGAILSIKVGTTVFRTKLIDGSFPEYTRVIPQGPTPRVEIDAAVLKGALERVMITAETANAATARTVALNTMAGQLTLRTRSDFGDGDYEVACTMLDPEPWETGFNGRYLLDLLAATGPDTITIAQADRLAPALIRASGDEATTHVLMPMRV